jgi:hypothetical protein
MDQVNGDRWAMPDGRHGLEVGRQGEVLLLAPIVPHWPFPGLPLSVPRDLCLKQPSKYHGRVMPEGEEALF